MDMTTKTVPDITPGYPSNGAKLGPAWSAIWRALARADDALDGRELAAKVAPKYELAPATLVALISRAAKAGLLDREPRPVITGRGTRTRTFYRIHVAHPEDQWTAKN
jgi:hypothetical protein